MSGSFNEKSPSRCVIAGGGAGLALAVGAMLAGCSADVTRFNASSYSAASASSVSGEHFYTSSLPPVPPEPISGSSVAPRKTNVSSVGRSRWAPKDDYRVASRTPAYAPAAEPRTQTVTVARGDTLSSISRRYNVRVAAIQNANGMQGSSLREGQSLVIPGSDGGAPAQVASRTAHTGGGTYRVKSGDSLYEIAQDHHVTYHELAKYNHLSSPGSLQPGQVLKIPGSGTSVAQAEPADTVHKVQTQQISVPGPEETRKSAAVRVASADPNAPVPSASARPEEKSAYNGPLPNPEPLSEERFRWPVQGRIISAFGTKANGSHNDGINIAVPEGTSVKAAENGVVAYSGNELKGYGNLVLIRHANNWVSAYAHNETLLVNRGDKVRRGQIIAKAGRTGSVGQPQVHFELRKGSRPVDPTGYMVSATASN